MLPLSTAGQNSNSLQFHKLGAIYRPHTTSKIPGKTKSVLRPFHAENSLILVCKINEHLKRAAFAALRSKFENPFEIRWFSL